jgi:GNAT superfamily N-acetyltransferase
MPHSPARAPEPTIRRAVPADAEALARVGAETFAETFGHLYPADDLRGFLSDAYGLERTLADLADPEKAAWLAEADGRAVGLALAGPCSLPHPQVTAACGELKRFYLLRPWQGGGLGGRLFETAMAWLERNGPRTIWIGVWCDNLGAQRFYARRGFRKVGEYGFAVGGTIDREYILRRPGWAPP